MEKAQIVKYALMQIAALIYGILASGTVVKFDKLYVNAGFTMPDSYYRAIFSRDYGMCLFSFVLLWTAWVSYLSSPLSKFDFSEQSLVYSGMAVTILFIIFGTYFAFGGVFQPTSL